jgi:methylated-DNA-[protein]-cysteine S-methyltransferase
MKIAYFQYDKLVLKIYVSSDKISKIDFIDTYFEAEEDEFIRKIKSQLLAYCKGELKEFDLDLLVEGTEFQKKVWEEMQKIPYGKTRTYGELAEKVGNPKGARAVGMACNKNKIPVIIPCHRVVGKNGKLTGFAGGLDIKELLLKIEGEKANVNK